MIIEFIDNLKWNLPKINNYEDYEYAPGCCCPNCEPYYECGEWINHAHDNIVGFCENSHGELELCHECPVCFTKFRYHTSKYYNEDFEYDVERWCHDIGLILYLDHCEDKKYDKFLI